MALTGLETAMIVAVLSGLPPGVPSWERPMTDAERAELRKLLFLAAAAPDPVEAEIAAMEAQ